MGGDPIMGRLHGAGDTLIKGRHIKSEIISPRADYSWRDILITHRRRDSVRLIGLPPIDTRMGDAENGLAIRGGLE